MEINAILIVGFICLFVIILFGIIFSKRNELKKINEKDEEMWEKGKKIICSRCGKVDAVDNYNDKPVCEDCFDDLDEDKDYDYDFTNSLTFTNSLANMIIDIIFLAIVFMIGVSVLNILSDTPSKATTNYTNITSNSSCGVSETLYFVPSIINIIGFIIVITIVLRLFRES